MTHAILPAPDDTPDAGTPILHTDDTPDAGTPVRSHPRRRAEDASMWFRIPPAAVSSIFGVLVAGGAGGGIYASHSTLTARVQEAVQPLATEIHSVAEGQKTLELKIARLEGRDVEASVRDLDSRLRSVEALTARLEGRDGREKR